MKKIIRSLKAKMTTIKHRLREWIKRRFDLYEKSYPKYGMTFYVKGISSFGYIDGDKIIIDILGYGSTEHFVVQVGRHKIGEWRLNNMVHVQFGDKIELPVKQLAIQLREAIAVALNLRSDLIKANEVCL